MTADLALAVRQARKDADREAGEAAVIGRQGKAARAEVARLRESLELHEKVLGVLTSVGEARQESAQRQVEGLVTRALQAIFEENLSFHLVPSVKGNQAVIDFVLRSRYGDTEIDTPVLDARGGGMAAVVGFVPAAGRASAHARCPPGPALDESFRHALAGVRAKAGGVPARR